MILKQERKMLEIQKNTTIGGTPYKSAPKNKPHRFYEYDKELSPCITGYQQGLNNPYIDYLSHLGEESNFDKKKILTKSNK